MAVDNFARVISLANTKKIRELPNGYHSLGEVQNYSDLPSTGNKVGNSYTVRNADASHKAGRYVWGKSGGVNTWYYLDGDNDYVSQAELDEHISANPTLIGGETALSSIHIKNTNYKIEGGGDSISIANNTMNIVGGTNTAIQANPTLAGTEGNLNGLLVGDTKYKVGGATIYCHPVFIKWESAIYDNKGATRMLIFNTNSTAYTAATLKTYLQTATGSFLASGSIKTSGALYPTSAIKVDSSTFLIEYYDGDSAYNSRFEVGDIIYIGDIVNAIN